MTSPGKCGAAFSLCLAALSSCAWSNPDNRPVWNAFEQHLVPEQGGWFVATLPLTVPGGLLALLTDAVIVHPAQIVDDAVDDAGMLWVENDPDWDDAYYTEMAFLPLRTVFTPVVFVGSFVGRSLFDIPRQGRAASIESASKEPTEEQVAEQAVRQRRRFVDWLADLRVAIVAPCPGVPAWHEDLAVPLALALQQDAMVRARVYLELLRADLEHFGPVAAVDALRDPDPVVRYATLSAWPASITLPEEALQLLRQDPCESVREQARRRFGD